MGKLELGLYDIKNRLQEPLLYSPGKTQTDLIEEILEAFRGNDIVFLKFQRLNELRQAGGRQHESVARLIRADANVAIDIGERSFRGRNEQFAGNFQEGGDKPVVRHIAWPDLIIDHVQPLGCKV